MAKKDQATSIAGTITIVVVCIVALLSVYYLYQVSVGKAFMTAPKIDKLVIKVPEYCCCVNDKGMLFETWKDVPKEANEMERALICKAKCEKDHSTPAHPATLLKVGMCDTQK